MSIYTSLQKEYLNKLLKLDIRDEVLGTSFPQNVKNKNFDSTNNFPNPTSFFNAGSNSTVNTLRFINLGSAVATAAGEPESNVAMTYDKDIIIKRIKYTIGSNSKNNVTNISLRSNFKDLDESVLSIAIGESKSFDSGLLNMLIPAGTPLCWKWDTTLSTSGAITIIFHVEYQVKLTEASVGTIPLQQQLTGLSSAVKPISGVANYSEFLETDTLEKYVIINGIWYNLSLAARGQLVTPDIDFIHNRVYTSGGTADFLHWCEPLVKYNKVVVPFSFLSTATPGGIGLSDDGINFREVHKSVIANENYWLTARDRGDLCLVGSGSSGAFVVGSVYRTQDGGETWTQLTNATNIDIRVYGIEYTIPSMNAIIITSAGAVPNTAGKILRSTNISIATPTFTTVQTLSEGARCIKVVAKTGTILVGTGHTTQAGIWRSIDEGATWTKAKTFTSAESTAIYWIQDITDPVTNVTKVYAFAAEGRVFESSDDGVSWVQILDAKVSSAPVRRIINYAGLYITANFISGINIFDYKSKQILPLFSESTDGFSAVPFYSVVKYQGGLVATMNNKILCSGKIKPCQYTLWSNKAVGVGGLDTPIFSKIAHPSLHNSAIIYSDQGGTVTVQVLDETLAIPVWRNIGTVTVVAATAKVINFVDHARGAVYWRFNFVPSLAANVDLWVVLD